MQRLKGCKSYPIVAVLAAESAQPCLPCTCSCFQLLVRPQFLRLSVPASTALPHPSCPSAANLINCNSIMLVMIAQPHILKIMSAFLPSSQPGGGTSTGQVTLIVLLTVSIMAGLMFAAYHFVLKSRMNNEIRYSA